MDQLWYILPMIYNPVEAGEIVKGLRVKSTGCSRVPGSVPSMAAHSCV